MGTFTCGGNCEKCAAIHLLGPGIEEVCGKNPHPDASKLFRGITLSMSPDKLREANKKRGWKLKPSKNVRIHPSKNATDYAKGP